MKVYISGIKGWVAGHVIRALDYKNCTATDDLVKAEAVIHLGWHGLPNYGNPMHFGNIGRNIEFLKKVKDNGITNITIAGTCLETLATLIPYSISKLAVRALATELFPGLKWARLWYLYGEGQNKDCLFPRLLKAEGEFSVIDGERDFIEVTKAADYICDIALQTKVTGIIDVCSGVPESVLSFCQRHAPNLVYKKDYPRPAYEPFSFCGDPTKLRSI